MAPEYKDDDALDTTIMGRIWAPFAKYRRQFAFGVIVIFVVAVAIELGNSLPRDVDVAFRFPNAATVTEARIEYTQDEEVMREVLLRWPNGAPSEVRDTVELSPGDYEISVRLVNEAGEARHLAGHLRAPTDGVVRVALSPH